MPFYILLLAFLPLTGASSEPVFTACQVWGPSAVAKPAISTHYFPNRSLPFLSISLLPSLLLVLPTLLPASQVLLMTLSNPPPTLEDQPNQAHYSRPFKELCELCLQKDASRRPAATELLRHKFFAQAKKPSFLVENLLGHLPPLEEVC